MNNAKSFRAVKNRLAAVCHATNHSNVSDINVFEIVMKDHASSKLMFANKNARKNVFIVFTTVTHHVIWTVNVRKHRAVKWSKCFVSAVCVNKIEHVTISLRNIVKLPRLNWHPLWNKCNMVVRLIWAMCLGQFVYRTIKLLNATKNVAWPNEIVAWLLVYKFEIQMYHPNSRQNIRNSFEAGPKKIRNWSQWFMKNSPNLWNWQKTVNNDLAAIRFRQWTEKRDRLAFDFPQNLIYSLILANFNCN